MIDSSTKKPVDVSTGGDAGPYIMIPVQQVEDIRVLLDAHNIPYWVDEDAISVDGKPAITVVNFSRGVDRAAVQDILDSAS